jgi:hypothetical protein
MRQVGPALVEFASHSTAGVVDVSLGFTPSWCIFIEDHGVAAFKVHLWCNNSRFSNWAAALSLEILGHASAMTSARNTSGITAYSGGDSITTALSGQENIGRDGAAYDGSTTPVITTEGVTIPAALQTNSARNLLIAFRDDAA